MTKLVLGCVVVSVVLIAAVTILLVDAGPEEPPRFSTISSAIEDGAEILDADKHGAITLTANGNVRGYTRDGLLVWERSFDRYEPNRRALLAASASCVARCPAAFLNLSSGYEGVGGADPAGSISRALSEGEMSLLAVIDSESVFASASTATGTTLRTITSTDPDRPSAPTLENVGIPGPGYVGIARDVDRAVVGAIGGDPPDGAARVRAISGERGGWTTAGAAIPEIESANACISPDGRWIGIASTRIRIARFGERAGDKIGAGISRGTCAIDDRGISAVVQNREGPGDVIALRYSHRGKTLWRRKLGRVRIVSDADAVNFVARSDGSELTTVIDATTGKLLLEQKLRANVFAADDGALVTANRAGFPAWVDLGQ